VIPSLLVAALAVVVQDHAARAPRHRAASALETVTVRAVRGGDAAAAQTTLGAAALRRGYTGQDVPQLLQQAPGVTTFAQSGSQWNYSTSACAAWTSRA
jgi:hypothetical protein